MFLRIFFIAILLPLISCSSNPYDTSTPEKFVESMGLISQQAGDEDFLPYFYDKESAAAIAKFDAAGENGLIEFNKFRNTVAEKFPYHVKTNEEGKLKVALDGFAGMNNRGFSYSASLVGAQLKERTSVDYEFISATAPDKNNIVQLTVKILGNEKTLPIKKTKDGYRMFLAKEDLNSIKESTETANRLEQVFVDANELLANGKITEENFAEQFEELSTLYAEALK